MIAALTLVVTGLPAVGCGSDAVCPLGTAGDPCLQLTDVGPRPDVPTTSADDVERPGDIAPETSTEDANEHEDAEPDGAASSSEHRRGVGSRADLAAAPEVRPGAGVGRPQDKATPTRRHDDLLARAPLAIPWSPVGLRDATPSRDQVVRRTRDTDASEDDDARALEARAGSFSAKPPVTSSLDPAAPTVTA